MADGALTKADMAERLFEELGLNKREAKEVVEQFFEEIRLSLERNEQVKLSGYGNFDLRDKKQRPGRNPKTGEEIKRITISIGVTPMIFGEEMNEAIARADEALYRAKEGGRNRVEIAEINTQPHAVAV